MWAKFHTVGPHAYIRTRPFSRGSNGSSSPDNVLRKRSMTASCAPREVIHDSSGPARGVSTRPHVVEFVRVATARLRRDPADEADTSASEPRNQGHDSTCIRD